MLLVMRILVNIGGEKAQYDENENEVENDFFFYIWCNPGGGARVCVY